MGDQSEEEDELDELEEAELLAVFAGVPVDSEEDFDDESEDDEPDADELAGVVDDDAARLSVR